MGHNNLNNKNYSCNKNGDCCACVSFHQKNGTIPRCFIEKDAETLEAERKEKERLEQIKLEAERKEKERLEQIKLEAERKEKERLEQIKIETERKEKERLEQIKIEAERKEKERLEQIKLETERKEKERLEQELFEQWQSEAENKQNENSELEKPDICPHPTCIEIFFKCCNIYGKLYISVHKDYYVGKCPRCKSNVTVPVGGDGPRFGLSQHKCKR